MKRLSADDSAQLPGVKVGHRQASYSLKALCLKAGGFVFWVNFGTKLLSSIFASRWA